MNSRQVAITISFLLSSNLVIGATYDLVNEQQNDLTKLGQMPLEKNKSFDSFLNAESFDQQQVIADKKQAYLDTLNLLKQNRLEEAQIKIKDLISEYPKEAEFYNLQGLLETVRKNDELAIKSYQRSIELNQNNLKAHLGLAMLFVKTEKLQKAKEHANKAMSINDNSITACFLLAEIAYKENRQDDVEGILLTAQKKVQGNIKQEIAVAKNLVKLYAIKKQPDKSLALAQQIIKRYPDNSLALSFLANAQIVNNDRAQAVKTLEKLIQLEKNDIPHRLVLAKLLLKEEKNEKQIIKLLDEITSISPDNPQVLAQKTVFLIKLKHFPEALNLVDEIRRLLPDAALADFLEGEIYLADKKLEQALSVFQKGYKITPNAKTLNIIVNILIAQYNQPEAIKFLKKVLENSPNNLAAHFKLASIYDMQKNSSGAEKHYQAILAQQPDNALVLNNLAWLYYQENNPKALGLAEQAYKQAPKSASIADTYGVILVKQGELAQGIKILEKASKQAPTAADIQYHLANAYFLKGNNKQAIKILNSIVKLKQEFTEKNAAISLLKKLEKK